MILNGSAAINLPGVDANQTDASLTWAGNAANATTAGTCSGNALTATTLQTTRAIGGVNFNGSADINLPGVNANQTDASLTWAGNAATATGVPNTTAPTSATDAGTAGEIRYGFDGFDYYLYICVTGGAAGVAAWKRALIAW